MKHNVTFSESELERLFGNEDAAVENVERLREYYFKHKVYNQVINDLSFRILVGHKGIGKSALFRIALDEAQHEGRLAIMLKPEDLASVASSEKDYVGLVSEWKGGLTEVCCKKLIESFKGAKNPSSNSFMNTTGAIVNVLSETVRYIDSNFDLAPLQKVAVDKFAKEKSITIYFDDLDRGWQGKQQHVRRLAALCDACKEISFAHPTIKFRLSLRSDVYYLMRTTEDSTDKIEGSVIWYSWTNDEILLILAKRVLTFLGEYNVDDKLQALASDQVAAYLDPILEKHFHGKGAWSSIPTHRMLMSLVRKRPRDLVKLCTLSGRKAHEDGSGRIGTKQFISIFPEYSQGRVADTVNEFKSEVPALQSLILNMKPNRAVKKAREAFFFDTAALLSKLKEIQGRHPINFHSGRQATPKELAQFLYKINFITARKDLEDGKIDRKFFEENRYIHSEFADFGYSWEIHPAYRWALIPESVDTIIESLGG